MLRVLTSRLHLHLLLPRWLLLPRRPPRLPVVEYLVAADSCLLLVAGQQLGRAFSEGRQLREDLAPLLPKPQLRGGSVGGLVGSAAGVPLLSVAVLLLRLRLEVRAPRLGLPQVRRSVPLQQALRQQPVFLTSPSDKALAPQ